MNIHKRNIPSTFNFIHVYTPVFTSINSDYDTRFREVLLSAYLKYIECLHNVAPLVLCWHHLRLLLHVVRDAYATCAIFLHVRRATAAAAAATWPLQLTGSQSADDYAPVPAASRGLLGSPHWVIKHISVGLYSAARSRRHTAAKSSYSE